MDTGQQPNFPALVLRIGLSIVIMWFGSQQLLHPEMWVSWVPEWTAMLSLTPERVVFLNGLFEITAGVLLCVGFYVRILASVLALHMAVLVLDIRITAVGVRDFGLASGFLSLALEKRHSWTVTKF
jgi:uncharacterized membrane protein YphA (DoxX/SURF4 family)